jgi:hypothetical protein
MEKALGGERKRQGKRERGVSVFPPFARPQASSPPPSRFPLPPLTPPFSTSSRIKPYSARTSACLLRHGRRLLQPPPLPARSRLHPPPRASARPSFSAQGPLLPPRGVHPHLHRPSHRPPCCSQATDASSHRRPGSISAASSRDGAAASTAFRGWCDAAASTAPTVVFCWCDAASSGSASGVKGAAEGHAIGESMRFRGFLFFPPFFGSWLCELPVHLCSRLLGYLYMGEYDRSL